MEVLGKKSISKPQEQTSWKPQVQDVLKLNIDGASIQGTVMQAGE
jgi:hypothetical protein